MSEWMDMKFWRTTGELTLSFLQPGERSGQYNRSGKREDYELKVLVVGET